MTIFKKSLALLLAFGSVGISVSAETGNSAKSRIEFNTEITEVTGGNTYHATMFLKAGTAGESTYTVLRAVYFDGEEGTRELERFWVERVTISSQNVGTDGMYEKGLVFDLTKMTKNKEYTVKAMAWKEGCLQPEVAGEISSAQLGVDFIFRESLFQRNCLVLGQRLLSVFGSSVVFITILIS